LRDTSRELVRFGGSLSRMLVPMLATWRLIYDEPAG
jgi:hypothetical protein